MVFSYGKLENMIFDYSFTKVRSVLVQQVHSWHVWSIELTYLKVRS